MEAQERLASSEAALLGERETAELRELFIAVLGHDLRNPLAAIEAGTRLLDKTQIDGRGRDVVSLIRNSVRRMAVLIDNVLDLASARLGGGFKLNRDASEPLGPALDQVVEEMRASLPGRQISADLDLPGPIKCDRARIAQLLSNLLANALTHGAPDTPVRVAASVQGDSFQIEVANQGEPIPAAVLPRLFEPFYRPATDAGQRGLGLGLYIAFEIAKAHRGTLTVTSSAEETRFVFKAPKD